MVKLHNTSSLSIISDTGGGVVPRMGMADLDADMERDGDGLGLP